ncbi:MAG TPA: GDP-mannose 4,6-dehydratase [Gemmatimonadota bacterium]|nr:GDP-mannose 4,6-dehydratase [Gemmatimonadota bacterium]
MRVFVTGIDSFVGRHLVDRLVLGGHAVSGSSLDPAGMVEGAERVVSCDVRDGDRVARVLREARPEAVVHLAGQTSVAVSFRSPAETFAINAGGALNVLEACREGGIGRVLLVTSCEVYGRPDSAAGPVSETAALAPISPYGASKAAQDILGGQYRRGLGVPVIRVRSFPHTGPGQAAHFLFPSVARRIALAEEGRGPEVIQVGRIDVIRDLLDVRDVVEAYAGLLERDVEGDVFNVCGGEGRSLGSGLEMLCNLARRPVRLETDPQRLRPADFDWMVGDPGRLRAALGWRPRRRWEETMGDLLADSRARVAAGAETETAVKHAEGLQR